MRTKLRNYITGNQLDKTFRAGETLEQAEVDKRDAQYTYQDGNDVSNAYPSINLAGFGSHMSL